VEIIGVVLAIPLGARELLAKRRLKATASA
jgi:hypothetical protein